MANYTAADIKALRERTGAGMMDVKKALDEANGDAEKAIEIIRIKGLKGATKREGRSTAEGVKLLRAYLQYAEFGGTNLGDAAMEKPQLNPFERDVRDRHGDDHRR